MRLEEIKKYIVKNQKNLTQEIEIDRDFGFSHDENADILKAQSIDKINEIIDAAKDKIYFSNYEYCLDNIVEEIEKEFEDLSYDEREDIEEYINELGLITLDRDSLINSLPEVDVNIFPLENPAEEIYDFYSFDDLLEINKNIGNPYGWSMPEYSQNILKIMKILQVNPYEVGEILQNRGDIEVNTFPNIEYASSKTNTAKKFIEELENGYDGNSFMITVKLDLSNYIKNFNLYKERGITIPAGARCGLINTVCGSCSFVEDLSIPEDLELKHYHMYLEDKMPGYGLDEIAGVVRSFYWNTTLEWKKNEHEKSIISTCKAVIKTLNQREYGFKKNVDSTIKILDSLVNSVLRNVENGGFKEEIIAKIKTDISEYYWVKEKGEEFLKQVRIVSDKLLKHIKNGDLDGAIQEVQQVKYTNNDFISPLQAKIKLWKEQFQKVVIPEIVKNFLDKAIEENLSKEEILVQAAKVKNMLLTEFKTSASYETDYRVCGINGKKFDAYVQDIQTIANEAESAIVQKNYPLFESKWSKIEDIIQNKLSELLNIQGYNFKDDDFANEVAKAIATEATQKENLH